MNGRRNQERKHYEALTPKIGAASPDGGPCADHAIRTALCLPLPPAPRAQADEAEAE
jgi:hypothetical protein